MKSEGLLQNYLKFAESIPEMVCILKQDGSVVAANTPWYQFTTVEIKENSFKSVIHIDDLPKISEIFLQQNLNSQTKHIKIRVKNLKKSEFYLSNVAIFPLNEAKLGDYWIAIFKDEDKEVLETKLKFTESALSEVQKNYEIANEARNFFIANISHEIRTPLGAILGFADLILDNNLSLEERKVFLKKIIHNGKHLTKIVDEILDLSKIESGHVDVEFSNFRLKEVLDDVQSIANLKAKEKDIALKFVLSPFLPEIVNSDSARLHQVVANIVNNAIRFTEAGQVKVSVECLRPDTHSGETDHQAMLSISVSDTGIGIKKDHQDRLFEPFFQSDDSMTKKYSGAGLGLALSKRLARALGGDIALVKSEPGKGSIFEILIKVGIVQGQELFHTNKNIENKSEKQLGQFKGLEILVVDDSVDNQILIKKMLNNCGADVQLAADGLQGLQRARNHDYDMILMDIQMPGMDGHEATRQLRKEGYRKPIVAVTAHAMIQDRELSFRSGCDDHLMKPLDKKSLFDTISHFTAKNLKVKN